MLHFAYGSNMDRALMRANCPSARALGTAILRDYRFIIAACGYASVERRNGARVQGVLWRLTPADVDALDRYESVATGLYDRDNLSVQGPTGRVPALVYVARAGGLGRPKPGYLELVVAAARDWQLPDDYVMSLGQGAAA
jgi:gamma-glutamylcyclotransferase (GGCT)/AIG2-like uncharacterized protein YtfP